MKILKQAIIKWSKNKPVCTLELSIDVPSLMGCGIKINAMIFKQEQPALQTPNGQKKVE